MQWKKKKRSRKHRENLVFNKTKRNPPLGEKGSYRAGHAEKVLTGTKKKKVMGSQQAR